MSPEALHAQTEYQKELESLHELYGSVDFTRSVFQVFEQDCPTALTHLISAIEEGDISAARTAIHSLANILGVVVPVASRPLVEIISADLKNAKLKDAAVHTSDLNTLIQAILASIKTWLDQANASDSTLAADVTLATDPAETVDPAEPITKPSGPYF